MNDGVLRRGLAAAAAAAVVSTFARAADPPHWTNASGTTINCTTGCHLTHTSLGNQLTSLAGNANLCQSCHNGTGSASALSVNTADMAQPAFDTGLHHAWNVNPVNVNAGAKAPVDAGGTPGAQTMANRLSNGTTGNIVCSTCHDQHKAASTAGGLPRISQPKKAAGTGTGTLTSGGTYTGTTGFWYLLELQSATTFRWSKDNGTTWMAQNVATGANVPLDNGVTVTFSGTFAAGDRWELNGSWPFLRSPIDSGDNATGSLFCRKCHADWAQDTAGSHTYSASVFRSHPVGVAPAASYDRTTQGTILDGNGDPQSTGDGNVGNDLRLDSTGRVQCWTCHAPHYATSNTNAVIP